MALNPNTLKALFSKLKGLGGSLKNKLGSTVSKGNLAPLNKVTGPTVATVTGPTVVDAVDDLLPFVGTKNVRGKYAASKAFDFDEGDVIDIGKRMFHMPDYVPIADTSERYRDYLEYLDDIEMDYGTRPSEMSFEEFAGPRTLNQMTKTNLLEDYLNGTRSYDSPEKWNPRRDERIKYGMPPPALPTYRFSDGITSTPPSQPGANSLSSMFDMYGQPIVSKNMFKSYRPELEDNLNFPDGFGDPEDFAKYYDSLELGYVPDDWLRSSKGYFVNDKSDVDFYDLLNESFPVSNKLPNVRAKRHNPRSIEELFSSLMFQDDSWIK